jgi:hypothetical protein
MIFFRLSYSNPHFLVNPTMKILPCQGSLLGWNIGINDRSLANGASFHSSAKNNALWNSMDEGVGRARAKANKEKADEDDTIPLTGALNG